MEILSPDGAGLDRAAALLAEGAVVGFPTDTVYGLAATDAGVEGIYRLKGRDRAKPLVLMAADAGALAGIVTIDARARRLMDRYWPGPLTLVLPAVSGGTVGVRVPDHALALELLRRTGPLWTTSANPSGEPESQTAAEVAERLPGLTAVVDGGPAAGSPPSTVLDLTGGVPVVLRAGAIEPVYR